MLSTPTASAIARVFVTAIDGRIRDRLGSDLLRLVLRQPLIGVVYHLRQSHDGITWRLVLRSDRLILWPDIRQRFDVVAEDHLLCFLDLLRVAAPRRLCHF